MTVKLARRTRGTRWLWCLWVCVALGCRETPEDVPRATTKPGASPAAPAVPGELPTTTEVEAAQEVPDGGFLPDGGRFRFQLEGVKPVDPGSGACPPGQYRCCDGSCSPTKQCPGIACTPIPEMRE
jgi:hypothetical protein